jgi:(R,R)-butanediol dehydrogenase/meso-butanediol dehydrogenase/diacetyl reductase
MRAARWHGRQDVRVENVAAPAPRRGELLLDVTWCGICGTDLEEYLHGPALIPTTTHGLTGRQAPLTLGHEFTGSIRKLGESVNGFNIGQRVAPECVLFCGVCVFCRRHEYALCLNWATIGLHTDGGLAEQVVVPAFSCVPLPDALADEEGALVEPTEVAVRAVRKSGLRLGERVAIIGGGTVGLLCLQVARAAGAASVYLVEPRASRRALASQLGATDTFEPNDTGWHILREACAGLGPDVVLECAGTRDSADLAIAAARKGGRIVLVGIFGEPVPINTLDLIVGEKQVFGTIQHHYDEDLPEAVRLLASGQVQARSLITGRISLDRVVEDGFLELAKRGNDHLKVLVHP